MEKLLILFEKINLEKKKEVIFFNDIIQKNFLASNKNNIDDKNKKIFEPYGLSKQLLYEDAKYLDKVFDKQINKVSDALNNLHKKNNSTKYWNIILGIWLRDLIYTAYNRFKTLKNGLKKFDVNEIILIKDKKNNFPIIESTTFNSYTNNMLFDAILVSNIFENLENKTGIKIVDSQEFYLPLINNIRNKKSNKLHLLNFLSKTLNFFNNSDESKYFILRSYLNLFDEIRLNFLLNKKIQLNEYPFIEYKEKKISNSLRLKLNFYNNSENEFENILGKIMPYYMPMTVIENYNQVEDFIKKKINWPKNPELIFTSNSFGEGGAAQFWIAEKVEKGSKYFIGQHGAGYLELYDKKFRVENKPSDGLVTWGKKIFDNKLYPLFNYTVLKKKKHKSLGKNLIIVFRSSGVRTAPYDRFEYGKIIYDNSIKIIQNLSEQIKKETILRLHSNYTKGIYFTFDNFLEKNKYLKIDRKTNYYKILKNSKLIIFNDYSSGFLQNLSLNYPSIVYLPLGLSFIHDENKADFEELIKENLIFTDIKKLNNHLNEIWDNIDVWWNSKSIVKTRETFLEKYSLKPSLNSLSKFSNTLKKFN